MPGVLKDLSPASPQGTRSFHDWYPEDWYTPMTFERTPKVGSPLPLHSYHLGVYPKLWDNIVPDSKVLSSEKSLPLEAQRHASKQKRNPRNGVNMIQLTSSSPEMHALIQSTPPEVVGRYINRSKSIVIGKSLRFIAQ